PILYRVVLVSHGHRRQLHEPLPRVDLDLARAQHLAGEVGRAGRGATPTRRTGVAVEQALAGQIAHVRSAYELRILVFEVHRRHDADLTRAARVGQEGIGERRDDVQMLGVRQVVQEHQDDQRVYPEIDCVPDTRDFRRDTAHHHAQRVAYRAL